MKKRLTKKQAQQIFKEVKSRYDFWLNDREVNQTYAEFGIRIIKYFEDLAK